MRKLVGLLALLLTVTTARADMYQDASNAKLPAAKNNLGIVKSVEDFGAKCDVQYVFADYTIPAGGTTMTLSASSGTGSIAGNILTVTAGGPFQTGMGLSGTGIASGTVITGYGTANGNAGTYTVSPSQSVGSTTITAKLKFRDIGAVKRAVLSGHAAGGLPLVTTLTPISETTATLGAPSVPGTPLRMMVTGLLSKGTGAGYAPGDTITMAGGTLGPTGGTPTIGAVQQTYARSAAIAAAGSGGTNGTWEVYGTTGNGMRFVGNLTVAGGAASGISITDGGHYTSNPTVPATMATVAPGVTLPAGATLSLTMDVDLIYPSTPGVYDNGGVPASFTQASTAGSGTGATFDPMPAYNSYGMVYGTDDSAAFNAAMNPQFWAEPQSGAVIEVPERPCGLFSTVTRSAASVEVRGTAAALATGMPPTGSTLQWLGAVGGTMWQDRPQGAWPIYNKMLGIGFSCGVPSGIFPRWPIPLAAVGLDARAQETPEYGWLTFDGCTKYDFYTDGLDSGNFQHAQIHDLVFQNANYSDGVGLYYGSKSTGGQDSDYGRIRNLFGGFQSAPMLQLVPLDNVQVEGVHFFQRGTQRVYGMDISGPVYGAGDNNQASSGYFQGISSSSVIRGLETSATPPGNVIIAGFDQANSVPVIAERPGHGNLTTLDYNGRMVFPPYANYRQTGSLALGRLSPFDTNPLYVWGNNMSGIIQPATAAGTGAWGVYAHDFLTTPSYSSAALGYEGSGVTGNFMAGVPNANLGYLWFSNTSGGVVGTNGGAPIIFATGATERGRIDGAGGTGRWLIGTTTVCSGGRLCLGTTGVHIEPVTVAALPACNVPNTWTIATVSDAVTPTYRAAIVGGGGTPALVMCNGGAGTWEAH